ncbi:MAG: hypothetical protein AAF417_21985 [Pseudomonadota bacterium]
MRKEKESERTRYERALLQAAGRPYGRGADATTASDAAAQTRYERALSKTIGKAPSE